MRGGGCAHCTHHMNTTPQVVGWAREEFRRGVAPHIRDECISLARHAMLLALEEEGALAVHPELREVVLAAKDLA